MSLPKFPPNDPNLTRDDVINQIISSIAMEELGLSHIINAEGEKLQYALGTIEGSAGPEKPATIDDILEINKSIHQTLNGAMMNQFFLKEKLQNALSASIMQGPTGPEGPEGPAGPATIKVYPDVSSLDPGDSPTVENVGPDDQHVELKFGIPKGAKGDTGAVGTILASYTDLDELEAEHPKGNQGDTYLVGNGDLYVWNVDNQKWEKVGNISGPAWDPGDHLFRLTGTSGTDEVVFDGSLNFESETLDITVDKGAVIKIENSAPSAGGIIPFATGREPVRLLSVKDEAATNVILAGFGSSSELVSITTSGFTFPGGDGYFHPFTLAHEITIKSIYFTTSNWLNFNPGAGISVFPYIILAKAAQGENNFTFLEKTKTIVGDPWRGGTDIPQNSPRYGSKIDIDQTLSAGDRLAICCAFDTQGGDFPPFIFGYYFYYSGSIYYEL